jgi:hypothetical protein
VYACSSKDIPKNLPKGCTLFKFNLTSVLKDLTIRLLHLLKAIITFESRQNNIGILHGFLSCPYKRHELPRTPVQLQAPVTLVYLTRRANPFKAPLNFRPHQYATLIQLQRKMGIALSQFQQTFPPKPTWSTDDIPDLTGKVVLITGGNSFKTIMTFVVVTSNLISEFVGNSGLGLETAKVC